MLVCFSLYERIGRYSSSCSPLESVSVKPKFEGITEVRAPCNSQMPSTKDVIWHKDLPKISFKKRTRKEGRGKGGGWGEY
jgi:hypothetical protein